MTEEKATFELEISSVEVLYDLVMEKCRCMEDELRMIAASVREANQQIAHESNPTRVREAWFDEYEERSRACDKLQDEYDLLYSIAEVLQYGLSEGKKK